jgi:hypothetical protein
MRDFWGQRPERHQPQEDEEHAHAQPQGDIAADFAFSLVDVPSGMLIPTLRWVHTRQKRRC